MITNHNCGGRQQGHCLTGTHFNFKFLNVRIRNENIVGYDTLGNTISSLLANCHISAYLVAYRMVIVDTFSHCGHVYGCIFSFSKDHSFFACKASGLQR